MMVSRVAAVGLVLAVPACTTIRQVQPAQFIPQHTPALVWVTTTSNAIVAMAKPQIDGDTLRGTWAGTQNPVAIPLQRIKSVHAKTLARTRTLLVFATLGLVAGVMFRPTHSAGSPVDPCPTGDHDEC
jgi:hypothetical protein